MPKVLRTLNPKPPWLVLYVAPVGRDSGIAARRDLCGRDESTLMRYLLKSAITPTTDDHHKLKFEVGVAGRVK